MNEGQKKQLTPKISFIVAAYNISKYLEECVNSILQYPGEDIEVVLVDDGSTDGKTGELCDAIKQRDHRVQVIHHENNSSLAAARNTGIHSARGKWLSFVDGDDRLSDGAVSAMLNSCAFDGQLIVFGAYAFRGDQEVYRWQPKAYTMTAPDELCAYRIDSMTNRRKKELYGDPNITTSWSKLFRTAFLRDNSLYFDPRICFSQDLEQLFRYTRLLTKIKFVPVQVYEYRLAIQTSLTKQWHPDVLEKQTAVMDALMKTMVDNHEENDSQLRGVYHYVGLFGITTRCIMQGVCHPKCDWCWMKCRSNLKQLRNLPWAAESLAALPAFKKVKMPWLSVLVFLRLRLYFPILMLKSIRRIKRRLDK